MQQWDMHSLVQNLQNEVKNVHESSDGQAINVRRYSSNDGSYSVSDVKKCEETYKFLTGKEEKVSSCLEEVNEKRDSLFKGENSVPLGKTPELDFYDECIQTLQKMKKQIIATRNQVFNLLQNIRQRFHPRAAQQADQQRMSRRKKEQKRKRTRRNESRLLRGANRLSNMMCQESVFNSIGQKVTTKIKKEQLDCLNQIMLTPKSDLKPLQYMVQMDAFEADCMNTVDSVISVMSLNQTRRPSKKPKIDYACQRTLLSMWTKKPEPLASDSGSETENSDCDDNDEYLTTDRS